jgi:antirestriction protein ArdC
MTTTILYNALDGTVKSRSFLEGFQQSIQPVNEQEADIKNKLAAILNQYPDADLFEIEIENFAATPFLAAPRHKGLAKEALDSCGRLKKGYRYDLTGKLIKVAKNTTSKLKSSLKNIAKKYNFSLGATYIAPTMSVSALHGTILADGFEIMQSDDYEDDYFAGLGVAAADVQEKINNLILEKINTGEELPPWKQSWAEKTTLPAQNFVSKRPYTGSNAIILNVLLGSIMPTPYYLTFKQVKDLKGKVKKGAKSIPLVYYNFVFRLKDFKDNPTAETNLLSKINGKTVTRKKKSVTLSKANYAGFSLYENEIKEFGLDRNDYFSIGFLKSYNVFNIADTEGIDYELPNNNPKNENEKIELCEKILDSFKDMPKVVSDPKDAAYVPSKDIIKMPDMEQFDSAEEYYSTLFHEMIHSTLHETRVNREKMYEGKEPKARYAFEELVGELGASYLCGLAGIIDVTHINQASYLKGWHEKLKNLAGDNPDFFVFATKEAQKAVDYIIRDFQEDMPQPKTEPKAEPKADEKTKAKLRAKARIRILELESKK